jgi:hypothetical protein
MESPVGRSTSLRRSFARTPRDARFEIGFGRGFLIARRSGSGTAWRPGLSIKKCAQRRGRFIPAIDIGERLAVGVLHDEGFLTFLDRPERREAPAHYRGVSVPTIKRGRLDLGSCHLRFPIARHDTSFAARWPHYSRSMPTTSPSSAALSTTESWIGRFSVRKTSS